MQATDKPYRPARKLSPVAQSTPRQVKKKLPIIVESQRPLVRIVDMDGTVAELPLSLDYETIYSSWTYILQSRRGWASRKATRDMQAKNAKLDLLQLGLTEDQLQRIARAGRIEVGIFDAAPNPLDNERSQLLYARRVPWEYLLSAATRAIGRGQSLSITRHTGAVVQATARAPRSVLYLESAPGYLSNEFDFSSERRVVTSALGFKPSQVITSVSETLPIVRSRIGQDKPDIIHIAGVDVHQATELRDKTDERNSSALDDSRDGLAMLGEHRSLVSIDAGTLADALVSSSAPPVLIAFNLYHSAAELAAEVVARGASAAIGFQDEIDDETAEFFFAALYREWQRANWNLFDAFSAAWRSLHGSIGHLHGTGIVLWSAHSAFAERVGVPQTLSGDHRRSRARKKTRSSASVADAASRRVAALDKEVLVSVDIQPEVNYALLHNEMPIFRNFTLYKRGNGPSPLVEVTVELNVGSDSYPFRQTLSLGDAPTALADKVKLPLTSSLARALRERVQSTLYVHVKSNGRVAHQQTERVTLLPVDEWLDDGKHSVWLPSFVLPRDPAVGRVIDAAQRYLMALQDDSAAGFDGYQQVDHEERASMTAVDMQVRALWCALSYDFGLSYINPPPAYSKRTQRLRTPSDVLNGKRGTCIDLALLLVACLEYIDIYPCIILLTGHAFPAYWRSDVAHEKFLLANNGASSSGGAATGGVSPYGWQFLRTQYAQIMQCIQRGDLVPLETVDLTSHTSFDTAMQNGLENLRSKRQFDSLLDLRQARLNEPPVTPLPIIQLER